MTDFDDDTLPFDEFDIAPARLTIDLVALADNWREMADLSGNASKVGGGNEILKFEILK